MAEPRSFVPLNFALLANPINWIVVILMLMIAGTLLHLLLSRVTTTDTPQTPAPANQGS